VAPRRFINSSPGPGLFARAHGTRRGPLRRLTSRCSLVCPDSPPAHASGVAAGKPAARRQRVWCGGGSGWRAIIALREKGGHVALCSRCPAAPLIFPKPAGTRYSTTVLVFTVVPEFLYPNHSNQSKSARAKAKRAQLHWRGGGVGEGKEKGGRPARRVPAPSRPWGARRQRDVRTPVPTAHMLSRRVASSSTHHTAAFRAVSTRQSGVWVRKEDMESKAKPRTLA
jgi:hypothetical protein